METFNYFYLVAIIIVAIWISIKDFKERVIPNMCIALLGILGVGKIIVSQSLEKSIIDMVVGMLLGTLIFLIPTLFINKIGAGDTKLAAIIGLNVGISGMMYTIVFMGIGAIIYFIVISLMTKTIDLKQTIPLGPFLMFGMIMSLLLQIRETA